MTYDEHLLFYGSKALRAVGWIALALLLAFCGLTAPLWFRSSAVQFFVYPSPVVQQAEAKALQHPGCEIYGKVVERNGQKAIRYRFPNDPDLESCFRAGVPKGYRIEKASWLQTQADRPRPSWY